MSQTLNLFRLQQIDTQIDRARNRLQAIEKILENDTELKQATEKARLSDEAYQTASDSLKQAELEMQTLQIKIEQNESSLYGGSAHSPKELQDLQSDVAALKRHRTTLEDRQLEAMIAVENAEAARKSNQSSLQLVREKVASSNQGLNQEQATLRREIERLSTERMAVSDAVPAETIKMYDGLRQQKRGLAITTVTDNSCDACGSNLNLGLVQSARSAAKVTFCPSCGRILYAS